MSVYEWPATGTGRGDEGDDPLGRQRFLGRRRQELDLDAALSAGRSTAPSGSPQALRRAGPLAPATGVRNLWLPLGPMTVLGGQAEGRPRVAGRVRALAVHPDGERLYAAAANGGIWYSADAGASWRSIGGLAATDRAGITRPAHRHACGAIFVRFGATAATDQVFVGTGEGTPRTQAAPGSNLGGVGIFVATGPATGAVDDPWTREAPNLIGDGVYRLAGEPGGAGVVAATSVGLFERPAGGGVNAAWTRVAGDPFDGLTAPCTDVLWTAGAGARPVRLWVWATGDEAGLWVRAAGETDFSQVETEDSSSGRSVLAAADPPTRIYVFNDRYSRDAPQKPALYRVAAAGAAAPSAERVKAGVPDMLTSLGFYDMAMAVSPADPDVVALGGAAVSAKNPAGTDYEIDDGAIFSAEVGVNAGTLTYGHPNPPTKIGVGAHADIHDLAFAKAGARLFTSCDGGVFRSDNPSEQVGFVACNDGLAVVEANYVASHPTCEGHVVVGLQDNGIIERGSTGVWLHTGDGDGGGIAFDPVTPSRYFRQYFDGRWTASSSGAGFESLLRRGAALTDKGKNERDAAAFYSMPAAIGHTRGATDFGQLLIGTDRVWYTDNWGTAWRTLPTGIDPITPTTYNRSQDRLREPIIVCRWASPEVAWILGEGLVVRLARTPATAPAAGGPGTWTKETLLQMGVKNKKDETSTEGPIREAAAWTDLAVNPDAGGAQRGTKGAVYLGTTGHPANAAVDTLWWFDGTDTWHPTGLRAEGVTAPVTAVLCDPANPNHVYVGTTVGVWRGTRTLAAGQPSDWAWEALVNGLPEAAVEDLSLFDSGGMRLLRAAIAARGVWELELDVDVEEVTYVRAHDDDLRRRARALGTKRNGTTPRSWHGSPDVRPRLSPSDVVLVPPTPGAAWARTQSRTPAQVEMLRRFQAALRSQKTDPRSRPTGVWDLYFEEVLRDNGAPTATKRCLIDQAYWNSVMIAPHATAEPWGSGSPSEADLYEFTPPLVEGDVGGASCALPAGRMKVDVVVHHRGLRPVDGADVRVTLLHWIDPKTKNRAKHDDSTTWFTGNVPWTGAVNDVLNSAGGTTARTFADGWRFTESGSTRRRTLTGQTLDPIHSGIVTFDIDLRGARENLVVLLVAVIRVGPNIALAPASLRDLVLDNPNVAVRSMRVNPVPRYGNRDLRRDDHDRDTAGTARYEGTDRTVAAGSPAHVAALQQDLVELGFAMITVPTDGSFGPDTEWAVREFQVHAGLPQAAALPPGNGMGIDDHAATPIAPADRFTDPITGVVDRRTRELIGLWIDRRWRCPVVVRAERGGVVSDNVWRASDAGGAGTVYSVRDLSGAYPLPPDRAEMAFHPLARWATYGGFSGGQTNVPAFGGPSDAVNRQVWAQAELLPQAVREDGTERTLTIAERSTFKVVRAVSEVECGGFLDGQNAYDRAFLSGGTFHWTVALANPGAAPDAGELPALFAFARYARPGAYRDAIERFGVRPDTDWTAASGLPSGERLLKLDWKYVCWLQRAAAGGAWAAMPLNEQEAARFRGWHWFYRLAMAARVYPEWRRGLYDFARLRLRDLAVLPWGGTGQGDFFPINLPDGTSRAVRLGDVFTSERSWAAVARVHVNAPGRVAQSGRASNSLHAAVAAAPGGFGAAGPDTWTDAHEQTVLAAWIGAMPAGFLRTSTEQARDWPAWRSPQRAFTLDLQALAPTAPVSVGPLPAIPAAGGLLSAARGSFVLDSLGLPPAPDYSRAA